MSNNNQQQKTINFEELQQKTSCNWCRNLMVISEPMSQANIVQTSKKYPALYCSNCLAIPERVKNPKSVINLDTLDEFVITTLPDVKDEDEDKDKKEEPAPEPAAAATIDD